MFFFLFSRTRTVVLGVREQIVLLSVASRIDTQLTVPTHFGLCIFMFFTRFLLPMYGSAFDRIGE